MFKINAADVKELRERTGVGMMECKKALTKAFGDMGMSIEYLRENGLTTAAKKATRIAAEGFINAYVVDAKDVGVLIEVNCETDFVAMNDDFQKSVQDITKIIAFQNPADVVALYSLKMTNGRTVKEVITEMIQTFGENISIRRFIRYKVNANEIGRIYSYIHSDALTKGKEGVILECSTNNMKSLSNPEFVSLMNDLTLQIIASKPEYVQRGDVSLDILEHERAIYIAQAINEGKTKSIAEKITQGRMEKFYREVCLLEQPYLRDDSKSVKEILNDLNIRLGKENISILRFTRYEKGEGIEKKTNDFAVDVMSQISG